uniref:Uncharacterized protein n=1 Tax=Meloidogyne hapla TaxID=6305 RepID=A0A1I8BCK6_MELHA
MKIEIFIYNLLIFLFVEIGKTSSNVEDFSKIDVLKSKGYPLNYFSFDKEMKDFNLKFHEFAIIPSDEYRSVKREFEISKNNLLENIKKELEEFKEIKEFIECEKMFKKENKKKVLESKKVILSDSINSVEMLNEIELIKRSLLINEKKNITKELKKSSTIKEEEEKNKVLAMLENLEKLEKSLSMEKLEKLQTSLLNEKKDFLEKLETMKTNLLNEMISKRNMIIEWDNIKEFLTEEEILLIELESIGKKENLNTIKEKLENNENHKKSYEILKKIQKLEQTKDSHKKIEKQIKTVKETFVDEIKRKVIKMSKIIRKSLRDKKMFVESSNNTGNYLKLKFFEQSLKNTKSLKEIQKKLEELKKSLLDKEIKQKLLNKLETLLEEENKLESSKQSFKVGERHKQVVNNFKKIMKENKVYEEFIEKKMDKIKKSESYENVLESLELIIKFLSKETQNINLLNKLELTKTSFEKEETIKKLLDLESMEKILFGEESKEKFLEKLETLKNDLELNEGFLDEEKFLNESLFNEMLKMFKQKIEKNKIEENNNLLSAEEKEKKKKKCFKKREMIANSKNLYEHSFNLVEQLILIENLSITDHVVQNWEKTKEILNYQKELEEIKANDFKKLNTKQMKMVTDLKKFDIEMKKLLPTIITFVEENIQVRNKNNAFFQIIRPIGFYAVFYRFQEPVPKPEPSKHWNRLEPELATVKSLEHAGTVEPFDFLEPG